MQVLALMIVTGFLATATAQVEHKIQTDPQTGRAAGAKEISPDELRSHINAKTRLLIIDVRDPEEFEKETIKGAINIPIAQLEAKLKDIPRDTTLAFT